jgi:hypothetical protein
MVAPGGIRLNTRGSQMGDISFKDHVAACEYMGEENPNMVAWTEGPILGEARIAYVEAHKAHMAAVEAGDFDVINAAWEIYVEARVKFQDLFYC